MKSKVRRGIGLVAHDAMKKDLIEWVLWNSELLMGNKFYCTGTTGTLILEALKEKHPDEEWDFTILKSGPLGGDQQMGSRIVDGQIDYLFLTMTVRRVAIVRVRVPVITIRMLSIASRSRLSTRNSLLIRTNRFV